MNARQYTDKQLKKLEKDIVAKYSETYKKANKELIVLLNKISMVKDLSLNEKLAIINRQDRFDKLCSLIAEEIKNTNVLAISLINQTKKDVFKVNYNETAEMLKLPTITNTESVDEVKKIKNPFIDIAIQEEKNKSLIAGKIKSELLTGLLLGQGISAISERLKNATQKFVNKSIGIARGETTTVENTAIYTVGEKAKKELEKEEKRVLAIPIVKKTQTRETVEKKQEPKIIRKLFKRWDAVNDHKTRPAHAQVDGKEIEFDKPFSVGGELMKFPGDRSLGATDKNIINCRCRTQLIVKYFQN